MISQLSARGMLVGVQLLHYFPKGSHLYPGEAGRRPWNANVFYDPPRAALNALPHHSREHQMQCDASLAGVPVQVLFDTGASDCFMNAGFARRLGFKIQPLTNASSPTSITYANGHKSPVVGMLTSSLKLCESTFHVRFLLADLSENLGVILGFAWLRDHQACWDFAKP